MVLSNISVPSLLYQRSGLRALLQRHSHKIGVTMATGNGLVVSNNKQVQSELKIRLSIFSLSCYSSLRALLQRHSHNIGVEMATGNGLVMPNIKQVTRLLFMPCWLDLFNLGNDLFYLGDCEVC